MPNWCYNTLIVEGQDKLIAKMMDAVKGEVESNGKMEEQEFSFHAIIPMPEDLNGICCGSTTDKNGKTLNNWRDTPEGPVAINEIALIKKHGACNWYDWAHMNWGTKWDASDVEVERSKGFVRISFTTAWCPPNPVLEKLAEKFPHLKFVNEWKSEGGGCGTDEF